MIRTKNKKIQALTNNNDKKNNQVTVKPQPLLYHTQKIQQKLSFLKQQIAQKKKMSILESKQTQERKHLHLFMKKINLGQYEQLLIENGIDSFDILKEAKQSELQQIGILKGHALKIMINTKRYEKQEATKVTQNKTTKRKQEQEYKNQSLATTETLAKRQIQITNIQTDSIPLQKTKMVFCLYCFKRSASNYCSSSCESLYGAMFQKYEYNLQKAQQSFIPKEQQAKYKQKDDLSDNQQFLQSFDFLFKPKEQDFNEQKYCLIKTLLKKQ